MNLPDREQFNFKEVEVGGDACWLITPKEIGCKWTDDIARFRSCIVRQSDNYVVSQGFGKFVNWGERPEFQPWDESWKFEARHKLDGSLLIVSRYKGEWICRTRGTVDARNLANGFEIDQLMVKYSDFFSDSNGDYTEAVGVSWLFEWTTPNNIIVLRESEDPKLTLLGAVSNMDASYYTQRFSDIIAKEFEFDRPVKYEYNSVAECLADVAAWQGKEGVVLYSPDYQTMKKIKADAYCELHKIATGLVTMENIVDLFIASPRFKKYSEFYHYVETTKDYEVAEKIKDKMLVITVAYCKVLDKIDKVKNIVDQVRTGFTRKEQAQQFQLHWDDWRLSASFLILDGKFIPDNLLKRAIIHTIDKE